MKYPLHQLSFVLIGSVLCLSSCDESTEGHGLIHGIDVTGLSSQTSDRLFSLNYYDSLATGYITVDSLPEILKQQRTYETTTYFWYVANVSTNTAIFPIGESSIDAGCHQVFYSVSEGLDLTIHYNDADDNGNPIGLVTQVVTGMPSSGQLTITLIHDPDKFASGVSDGNLSNAKGQVDFEHTFNVVIE